MDELAGGEQGAGWGTGARGQEGGLDWRVEREKSDLEEWSLEELDRKAQENVF